MSIMPREKLLAKPEMKQALAKLQEVVREVLPAADFTEQERVTLVLLDEAGRAVIEGQLRELALSFDDEVLVNGVPYKRHLPGTETYHSLSGPLVVPRDTYRKKGVHNGPTVVPMDLCAGIVEGATPALAYNVAHGYAQHDMRQHGDSLSAAHRLPPPRATLERLAKRIATAATEQAPRIESRLRRAEKLPEEAHAISIGLDRTSTPMAERRPEDAPPKPEPKRTKPRVRKTPPPIDVNYRMAYVGTVSIVDTAGQALVTRRAGAARRAVPARHPPERPPAVLLGPLRTRLQGQGQGCMIWAWAQAVVHTLCKPLLGGAPGEVDRDAQFHADAGIAKTSPTEVAVAARTIQ